jgi:UDP-N-acetylglucosamine 3-dehydrogenase
MDPVRFALVGCGNFGIKRANAFSEINIARLACTVDASIERARLLAVVYGCDYYADPFPALSHNEVDCVIVATPNATHAQMSIDAMTMGKHVLCEKPLATSLSEAILMVQASEKNNVKLKVGSNVRYFPNVRKAKEVVTEGKIGDLLFLRGWIGNAGAHLSRSWYAS